VWISPGLWFCSRSEIESRSSRFQCLSPCCLVASNLDRNKASYLHHFSSSILFVPIAMKIGPPTGWSLSFSIRFQVSTVGSITISSISYLCFFCSLSCVLYSVPIVHEKSYKKKPNLCVVLLVLSHLHLLLLLTIPFTYCYIYQHHSVVFLKKGEKEKRERSGKK
jgi:hypothetical protein